MATTAASVLLLKAADERYREALERLPGTAERRNALSAHFADVLTFRYVNAERLGAFLRELERFGALLLTSPRAAIAVARAIKALGGEEREVVLHKLRALPVFSVGVATSRELGPLGIKCLGDDSGSAEALAEFLHGTEGALPPDCVSKPTLFLCGEKRREVLPDSFRERRLPLEQLIVYETCAVDALAVPEACGTPAWVVFFSPSGVKVAKDVALPWQTIKKAAIGTAHALRLCCSTVDEGPNADVCARRQARRRRPRYSSTGRRPARRSGAPTWWRPSPRPRHSPPRSLRSTSSRSLLRRSTVERHEQPVAKRDTDARSDVANIALMCKAGWVYPAAQAGARRVSSPPPCRRSRSYSHRWH
jgi:uroporphyrinogen-III synthase